jgi:dolichyl-phosphate-mannose-protein mannosyltransferase
VTVNLSAASPTVATSRATVSPLLLDLALATGLGALALALRLQQLLTVPRFSDEQLDVLYTLPLYRLQALPLVAFDPYNGPLFSGLLAAFFWLIGPRPEAPRLLVTLLASATVVLTFLLGRALGGRLAGLVAAGLLATCATHVLVNSHVAWSNATTPFFTTLAILTALPAVRRGSGRHLALSGLAFGVALQSHPSVIAMLPGVGLAVLLKRWRLALSRWTLLAGALFLLGYSPVIVYNLFPDSDLAYRQAVSGLVPDSRILAGGAGDRLEHEREMNAEGQASVGPLANSGQLLLNLPRVAGSLIETKSSWTQYLLAPTFWIYGLLLLAGLLWPAWRGQPLTTLAGLGFLGLLAIINNKYEPIFNGRYVMAVLLLAFVGFGWLASECWSAWRRPAARLGLGLGALALVLWPILPLQAYLGRNAADGQVDLDLIQSAATMATARRPDELILLDETLGRRGLSADGDLLQNLRLFLELRGTPYRVGAVSAGKIETELGGARVAIVAVTQPYPRELDDRFRFTSLEERTAGRYAIYRLERR